MQRLFLLFSLSYAGMQPFFAQAENLHKDCYLTGSLEDTLSSHMLSAEAKHNSRGRTIPGQWLFKQRKDVESQSS